MILTLLVGGRLRKCNILYFNREDMALSNKEGRFKMREYSTKFDKTSWRIHKWLFDGLKNLKTIKMNQ